ncbi:HAMP domain-containing protein [Bacillus shivajii]|uniref:sensor histidine kinase n=1 Tax=Bacillus shivajii TaxID=1983719 RepID=UPI001CFA4238|nr:ATP-binding protein [Bacillus shivajii]UCZ53551.1 HAMP domain-containing protein [Bacillus shivajii]
MLRTLHSRLLTSFLALSLGGIFLVAIAIFFGVQETFDEYLATNREAQISTLTEEIESDLQTEGALSDSTIMLMHHYGFEDQLYFQLYTLDGELLLDSAEMGGMRSHMMGASQRDVDLESDMFDEKSYPLIVNGEEVATIIAYYPATFLTADIEFLTQFNKYLIGAVIIMTALSLILSFVFSKRLTRGLKKISQATNALKRHQLKTRIPEGHEVKEIEELSKGFNELAESLNKGEQLRRQFTSDLAHELRTPLATLRSQLESMQDGIFEPTEERLGQCHQELMRLVRLVNEMEKLHAAENPQLQLYIEELNVEDLLSSLYERFKPSFEAKGITFTLGETTANTFYADQDRFIQIMTNLLNNALKYTDEGDEVELSAFHSEEGTQFIVKDTGQGMTEEELNHIYERFFRGEKSRNRKTGGLGIGLSIVKALIDAHKGSIQVESNKGVGTTVTVTFK